MSDTQVPDRVFTVPNGLSLLRLLGVPLFLWLVLGVEEDVWALVVLALAGLTDWLDGKIARVWDQASRIGQMLDPAADRLYMAAAGLALWLRGIVPLWLVLALLAREVVVGVFLPVFKRRGYWPLPVNLMGKAATFCLMYGFPLLLLSEMGNMFGELAKIFGWAFTIWGAALYWWAGALYLIKAVELTGAGAPAGGREKEEGVEP